MELQLKNIGKVKEAKVKIGGLTVIAGVNDTGKSTIGKVMFCILMSAKYYDRWYKRRNNKKIKKIIDSFEKDFDLFCYNNNTKYVFDEIKKNKNNVKKIHSYVEWCENNNIDDNLKNTLNELKEIKKEITEKDKFEEDINEVLNSCFAYYINNSVHKDEGKIKFIDKGNELELLVDINNKVNVLKMDNIKKMYLQDVIFIDNPLILDYGKRLNKKYKKNTKIAKNVIEYDLLNKLERIKELTPMEINENKEKLKKIEKTIKEMTNDKDFKMINYNEVSFNKEKKDFQFKVEEYSDELDISNMASGGKTFSMLNLLIQCGIIANNKYLIILDEPENHLHPEWQVKYAKIIIFLIKYWNCNFIINSHSPYFIQGLKYYGNRFDITDKMNFYFAKSLEELTDKEKKEFNIIEIKKNYSLIKKIDTLDEVFSKFQEPIKEVFRNV
ncbi:MAG: AAA family ATPase [Rickettsiales bacterium]|nr:MAG: AAA family ATPase [Rickettsiales bacterium]